MRPARLEHATHFTAHYFIAIRPCIITVGAACFFLAFRRRGAHQQESTAETQPQTPTGLAELIGSQFPVFHGGRFCSFCSPHYNETMIRTAAITELIHENQSDHSNDNARTRVSRFRTRKAASL